MFALLRLHYLLIIYPIICLKSVDVRSLQVAILAQSPREMSQTDRILPRYFLSRVRISIRHRIFLYAKKPTSPVACFSATDRQNGAIWKAVYTFTPGGDLRHNSHKMSASAMDGFVGAPAKPPQTKRKLSALQRSSQARQRSSQARQRMRSIREEATVPTPPSPRPSLALGPGYPPWYALLLLA